MDAGLSDEVVHHQPGSTSFIAENNLGSGDLYIRKSSVLWKGSDGKEFTLCYPSITLHAISRDLSAFSLPCLYCMVEGPIVGLGAPSSQSADGDEDEEDSIQEVRFAPSDASSLETMYAAMCECQALHPDPEDMSNEDDEALMEIGDGGEFYTNEDDAIHLDENGMRVLEHLENSIQMPAPEEFTEMVADGSNGCHIDNAEDGQFDNAD